jgi:hypothetical protein
MKERIITDIIPVHIPEENRTINVPVRCIFLFKKYSDGKYQQDFQNFVDFQTNKTPRGEFVDYKLYNLKNYPLISYEYFADYASKLFSMWIFNLIKSNPENFIPKESTQLNVQIYFKRIKDWEYSFETEDKLINAENACYTASGMWFLNNIVAPYYYLKKFDVGVITKYFLHEFTHYVDMINNMIPWEDERMDKEDRYKTKIMRKVGRRHPYGINFIYNSMFNLREEGIAYFSERANTSEMLFSKSDIIRYNSNLRKVAFGRYKKNMKDFYFKEVGELNNNNWGESIIGRNMCLFVAMALAKAKRIPFVMTIRKQRSSEFQFDNLDSLLSKGEIIGISGIREDIINEAKSMISKTTHYYFLKLYEKSCDILGISEENRAMTCRRFFSLVQETKTFYQNHDKKTLEGAGYLYLHENLDQDSDALRAV